MSDRRRSAAVIAAYALLALLVIPVYPHLPSPNEFTRWLVVAAVVEYGTIEVSRVLPVIGSRLEDLAVFDGRVYSNKAPGVAIVSAPGYLLFRPFVGPPSAANLRPALYAMRLFGATAPLVGLLILFVYCGRKLGIDEPQITRGLVTMAFATPLFAYGLLLFSHALAAASLFAAWGLLYVYGENSWRRAAAAGAFIGLATIAEFPSVVAGGFLLIPLLIRRRFRRFVAAVAGGLPFAVILGGYQKAAFGSAFRLFHQFEKIEQFRKAADAGFLGIQVPSFTRLGLLLFDLSKGLLVFSPIVVLAAVGFIVAFRTLARDAAFALVAAPVSLLLIYAGYENWHGGWTVSARYLVAAVPFFATALLFVRWNWISSVLLVLLGWSAVAVIVTSLVFPFVPRAFPLPWGSLALPLLSDGLVVPNAFHFLSPLVAVAGPFMLAAAAVGVSLRTREAAFVVAGALLALGAGAVAARNLDPVRVLQRAYIQEVYFEQRGAMSKAFPGTKLPPPLLQRRAVELRQPPESWNFR